MIGKKINQLATELAPVSTDLTIIGDPISGVSKKITLAQLGAIFSGAVSFYDNLASFPATGDINVIYCAKDTKKLYLWSGSAYVEVFPSQELLDTYQLRSEKGVSNGYASLDSGGKVPISQLPSSIMEYKGMWNAATNTPTLANGTGDTGDVYICNVAGTVNFGAGAITFAVGDYVIYSGSIWQRSSGAVGTVTSVAASITGDAIGITGSPVTTSGTLALAFAGTSSQYINGAGNLTNFPTSLVTGTGTIYSLTKWGFTSGTIINSNLYDTGTTIYNNNATAGSFAVQFNGNTTSGMSYGLLINAGSDANDIAFRVQNVSSTSEYFFIYGDGKVKMNNIPNATTDTDTFLVSDGGFIKYRTGAELLSDIGGASASGYVPYTGATTNVDLGTHTLLAKDLVINHSSGSGVAASITKGGAGEALTVVKSSGSGNAASITGGVTLLDELHLNTDLADAYIASASNWNDAYNLRHNAVTLGTANGLSLSTQVLSLALASGSTTGALSSTDWTTFNNKQSALTNPVTGTGTTNYLPKFTGTSTIGNSQIFDDGTNVTVSSTDLNTIFVTNPTTTGATTGSGIGFKAYNGTSVTQFGGIFLTSNTWSFGTYSTQQLSIGADGTGGLALRSANSAPISFFTGGASAGVSTLKMTLNSSGNLGLGVTPSAWNSGLRVQQIGYSAFVLGSGSEQAIIGSNWFQNTSASNIYLNNGFATFYQQVSGQHQFFTAPSGTAGNAISFTQAMTLNASGNLSIGNTNDSYKLDVSGTGRFTGSVYSEDVNAYLLNQTGNTTDTKIWSIQNLPTSGQFRIRALNDGMTNGINAIVISRTGISSLALDFTGAATFSSSVTAGGDINIPNGNYYYAKRTTGGANINILGIASGSDTLTIKGGTSGATNSINFEDTGGIIASFYNGRLGIGTTSPAEKLTVVTGTNYAAAFNTASIENTTTRISIGSLTTGGGGTGGSVAIGAAHYHAASAQSQMLFYTHDGTSLAERMRITSGGAVEMTGTIKTAAPTNGTAQPWKLGNAVTGTCVPSTFGEFGTWFQGTVIQIEVNGTTYKIPAVIDNYC